MEEGSVEVIVSELSIYLMFCENKDVCFFGRMFLYECDDRIDTDSRGS